MSTGADKPNLLVLTSTFPRWPNDNDPPFVHELCQQLRADFEITVLAPHAPGARRHERIDGIRVDRFRYAPEALELLAYEGGIPAKLKSNPVLWLLVPVFVFAQFWTTLHLIRSIRPSAIHAHWLIPQGLIGILARIFSGQKPAILMTAHGADLFAFEGNLGLRLKRWALGRADHVSVVSNSMAARVHDLGVPATSTSVAPMGIDLVEKFVPSVSPAAAQTILFAGRLVEKKGVADLLQALPSVLSQKPRVQLLIVGDGPLRQKLTTLARHLGIEHAVEFLGRKTPAEMPFLYHRASIAVLPFRIADDGDQEGLGLVAVEAMGCGLPVIVGDVPAIRDVVNHAKTGWIVPTGNPNLLAEAILHLIQNPEIAAKIANAARAYVVEHFDWSVSAQIYRSILHRLTTRK